MKKSIIQKLFLFSLILAAFGVTYYFYQRDEITFFPQKEGGLSRNFTSQIPFSKKEYKLSYQDKMASAFDIAGFEENENWYGDGEFDHSTFYEGESSLFLTSFDGQETVVSLKKGFDLKDATNFKFLVYLATDPDSLEEFNLIFTGKNREYKFPIRDINKGWNFLVLPKENFSAYTPKSGEESGSEVETGIQGVVIELVSRPKTRSTVNLDALWAEKEKDYLDDWNTQSDRFLSLKDNGGLLAIGMTGQRATLKIGSAKDYTFQAKFTPLKSGDFGFLLRGDYSSGYGYYLVMNGVDTNDWRIYKQGSFEDNKQNLDLARGEVGNFLIERNKPYWLKAEAKGTELIFSISTDGQTFVRLGEISDASFSIGGVGIAVSQESMALIDDLQFFQ